MTVDECELASVKAEAVCVATAGEISAALNKMASELLERVGHGPLLVLCVMNGGLLVTAELMKRIPLDLTLDYIHASRYRERIVGEGVEWRAVPSQAIEGRSVVIVDDIFNEGITLSAIADYCRQNGASSVTSVVLVDKCHARKLTGFRPDVVGLRLPDRYLYGFGMDYKGYLRNCAEIYALRD